MDKSKDFNKEIERIYKHGGNDPIKKGQALSKIVNQLAAEPDTAIRTILINEIANKYPYTKGELNNAVNKLIKKRSSEEKEEKETTTLIDIQEKAIAENFDIEFNEISLNWEITDYETEQPASRYDILRKLKKLNISITDQDLTIILKSSFTPKANPIAQYFETLTPWDQKTDHIQLLTDKIQVNERDTERFKTHFKKALIRSIACALEMDFNKHCLVLVGDGTSNQNSGKTSFIRWLTPEALQPYYMENLPPGDGKDSLRALAENFILNLDELEALWRTDKNKLKSLFSQDFIKVRIQYDRTYSTIKRRANFWASTNESEFLTDLTGNVRWIGFKLAPVLKPINWDYCNDPNTEINKIWAQAYHLLKNGEAYKLTPTEVEENERANDQFLSLPAEYDILQTYYQPASHKKFDAFYTATDFLQAIIDKTGKNIKMNKVSLGRVLRKLGYEPQNGYSTATANKSGYQVKGYYIKVNDTFERSKNKENREQHDNYKPDI